MLISNIRKIMKEKNITMESLSTMTGLSTRTIDRARGGLISECKLSTLGRIATALGVPMKTLFDGEWEEDEIVAQKRLDTGNTLDG